MRRGGFVGSANSVRAGQGLPPLEWDGGLAGKASGWAQTMADAGSIFHSNLPDGVSADWYRLGENVGKGPDTGSIAQALINSPGHYANLIDPGFRYVGVGVVSTEDTCYVSEVFMEPSLPARPKHVCICGRNPELRRLLRLVVVRRCILGIVVERTSSRGAVASAPATATAASGAVHRGAGATARPRRVVAGIPPPAATHEGRAPVAGCAASRPRRG